MMTILASVGGLVCVAGALVVVAWVVSERRAEARHARDLEQALRRYVERRGATIAFHGDTLTVEGAKGSGVESLRSLRFLCAPGREAGWDTTIGFALRKYIPDGFDELFAKQDAERLARLSPEVAAMPVEELLRRARVKVIGAGPALGLATTAQAVGGRFEARVVLDGIDLRGIPEADRRRIPLDNQALFEHALAASLPASPPTTGTSDTQVWLCRPEVVWGTAPTLIAGAGQGLAWTPAEPGDAERRLAALAGLAFQDGPMKCVLWTWDGVVLDATIVIVHTVRGPDTPHYSVKLSPEIAARMGLQPRPDGVVAVWRT